MNGELLAVRRDKNVPRMLRRSIKYVHNITYSRVREMPRHATDICNSYRINKCLRTIATPWPLSLVERATSARAV